MVVDMDCLVNVNIVIKYVHLIEEQNLNERFINYLFFDFEKNEKQTVFCFIFWFDSWAD